MSTIQVLLTFKDYSDWTQNRSTLRNLFRFLYQGDINSGWINIPCILRFLFEIPAGKREKGTGPVLGGVWFGMRYHAGNGDIQLTPFPPQMVTYFQ